MTTQVEILQQYTNRFQKRDKQPLLVCDGDVGPNTVAAVNRVLGGPISKADLLGNIKKYVSAVQRKAGVSFLWASAPCGKKKPTGSSHRTASPTTNQAVIDTPGPQLPSGTGVMGSVGGVPYWAIALLVVGGVVYYKKKDTK